VKERRNGGETESKRALVGNSIQIEGTWQMAPPFHPLLANLPKYNKSKPHEQHAGKQPAGHKQQIDMLLKATNINDVPLETLHNGQYSR